ncbi:MAG: hypothetical protein FWG66_10290 [Spirochaetes bacterium]|nr:hypothetical protein [Spirochaetota bacterium]
MAINLKSCRLVFALALFTAQAPLWAQYDAPPEGEPFSQRLSWTGGEYAMHYEIVIEAAGEDGYRLVVREITAAQYIILNLPPGVFRAMVIPYDYLFRPGEASQWVVFTVIPFPGQDIFLTAQEEDDEEEAPEDYVAEVAPEEFFSEPRSVNMFLRLAWMPVFSIYGSGFIEDNSLAGAGLRFGAVAERSWFFNPGLELGLHMFAMNHAATDVSPDGGSSQNLAIDLNFLAQRRLFEGVALLTLRAGGGYAWRLGEFGAVFLNTGLSFKLFPWEIPLFFEAALDYSHFFSSPNSGALRPWLGFGIMF